MLAVTFIRRLKQYGQPGRKRIYHLDYASTTVTKYVYPTPQHNDIYDSYSYIPSKAAEIRF